MSANQATVDAQALIKRVIKIVDRPENVKEKFSHPFSAAVRMECDYRGLHLYARGQSSGYGNGSLVVRVSEGEHILLDAEGPYIGGQLIIKTYEPGQWEKVISSFQ